MKEERIFIFQERLVWSDGSISEKEDMPQYLLSRIPLAVKVERAIRADDRKGIDWWVTLQSGQRVGVDVKVRDEDWARKGWDDIALEIWSVVEKQIIGWTRDPNKQSDYIVFLWKDTGRCVIMPFPWLCSIFIDHWEIWQKKFKTAYQNTENRYHSQCVFVPRELVLKKFYAMMGGVPLSQEKSA